MTSTGGTDELPNRDRPPRTAARDLCGQALRAVLGRPARTLLTVLGIGIAIAALVTTLSVTSSAAASISDRFDALQATQVTLRFPEGAQPPTAAQVEPLASVNGVEQAGLLCRSQAAGHRVTAVDPAVSDSESLTVSVVAAQPSTLDALGTVVTAGRAFDAGHGARSDAVALVDAVVAENLGIREPDGQLIYVAGRPVSVIGLFQAPAANATLTRAVVVPYESCVDHPAVVPEEVAFHAPEVVIRTRMGAADQVAQEAPLAVHPTDPDSLFAMVPPDLGTFREGVESDTRALFLGLALVSLVIGALGVSNTTLVSVLERRSEIGLRRALGASRRAVGGQFLIESGVLGFAGGLLGTVLAVNITAAVTLARQWLMVVDPWILAAGPVLGLAVGVLAGAYPAWKASTVVPATTLRP